MDEIYGLVDEAFRGGQEKVQLEAFPFRMTTQNLARHADDPNTPFWEMLKTGSDAFLSTGRPPTTRFVLPPVCWVSQSLSVFVSLDKSPKPCSPPNRLQAKRPNAVHNDHRYVFNAAITYCFDKFPAWARRRATSSPLPTTTGPCSTSYAKNSTPPAAPAMCCGTVAVIESRRGEIGFVTGMRTKNVRHCRESHLPAISSAQLTACNRSVVTENAILAGAGGHAWWQDATANCKIWYAAVKKAPLVGHDHHSV